MAPSVTATLALKITTVPQMAFMIGMCFFPTKMMEGYKADTFSGTGASFFQFAMGIMGVQMMYSAMITISSSKPHIPNHEKSMACLCNALIWAAFVILDGRLLLGLAGGLPEAIPSAAVAGNLVMFAAIAAVNFLGWRESGAVVPNFGAFFFQGTSKVPLIVNTLNLLFFAVGCGFATAQFLDMYAPGVLASLPSSEKVTPMVLLILGNAGKLMLLNIFSTHCIASVGDAATSYRLLRLCCFTNLFYMGTVAREHIIFSSLGWPAPMYTISFIQCFAVTFFMCNKFGGTQVTLKDKSN